jgi:hypothetical protein
MVKRIRADWTKIWLILVGLWRSLCFFGGSVMIVVGIAEYSRPVAIIVAGVMLMALTILAEYKGSARP